MPVRMPGPTTRGGAPEELAAGALPDRQQRRHDRREDHVGDLGERAPGLLEERAHQDAELVGGLLAPGRDAPVLRELGLLRRRSRRARRGRSCCRRRRRAGRLLAHAPRLRRAPRGSRRRPARGPRRRRARRTASAPSASGSRATPSRRAAARLGDHHRASGHAVEAVEARAQRREAALGVEVQHVLQGTEEAAREGGARDGPAEVAARGSSRVAAELLGEASRGRRSGSRRSRARGGRRGSPRRRAPSGCPRSCARRGARRSAT